MSTSSPKFTFSLPDPNDVVDSDKFIKDNFNKVESQVYSKTEVYSKSEMDTSLLAKVGGAVDISVVSGLFFTNGASSVATAAISFGKTYATPPYVFPGNLGNTVAYSDTLRFPYIYNVSTTGFSCKLLADGNLGDATPVNLIVNFLVIGR